MSKILAVNYSLGTTAVSELIDITPAFDSRLTYTGDPTYLVAEGGMFDGVELEGKVTVEYALHDYSLTELKSKAIQTAYANCEAILNQYAKGYSMAEIATFPAMQAEILAYVSTGTIGLGMQTVINRGRHTAESLTAVLMPKITAQQSALLERDNHVAAISNMINCIDVVNYLMD